MTEWQEIVRPDIQCVDGLSDRVMRLRQAYWDRRHYDALVSADVEGCGQDSLIGHARDFAALLDASPAMIFDDELIVGSALASPVSHVPLDMGYYNAHYPPGYATLMTKGIVGIRDEAAERLQTEPDPASCRFLSAVEITCAAVTRYAARYAQLARELARTAKSIQRKSELLHIAKACLEIATGVPTSFQAGLQLVQFVRLFGGMGCLGRYDQWLYPLLASDLFAGDLSREQALELVMCSFIKMNEFATASELDELYEQRGEIRRWIGASNDSLRNIALGGLTPGGGDASNTLTYLCLEASAKLMLPEPKINVRFYTGTPPEVLDACCQVVASGNNVLAFFNDEVAIPSLLRLGIPMADARDYCNDGCSELIIGGKGTIKFQVHDALPTLTELIHRMADDPPQTFDALMDAYLEELLQFMPEAPAEEQAITHPFFAATIEDCLAQASPTGARYPIRGAILAQVGNAADGLAAIRQLIYEQGSLTWPELADAMTGDYCGCEPLRLMIQHRPPKYGNDQDEVDALVRVIAETFCKGVHARGKNAAGPGPKWAPGLMCFGLQNKRNLPASPDGRRKGDPTANSFSPAVGMDHSGPTAVLKSVSKTDLTWASHGSVLDIALHGSVIRSKEDVAKLASLVRTYLDLPCTTTLQLNVIDRETLLKARENPTAPEFKTLIVRVWGFSAVFVDLPAALQDHVLARTEHGAI